MRSQPTVVCQTPSCFVCGRVSRIELPRSHRGRGGGRRCRTGAAAGMPRPEREQLISGTHSACWAAAFGEPYE